MSFEFCVFLKSGPIHSLFPLSMSRKRWVGCTWVFPAIGFPLMVLLLLMVQDAPSNSFLSQSLFPEHFHFSLSADGALFIDGERCYFQIFLSHSHFPKQKAVQLLYDAQPIFITSFPDYTSICWLFFNASLKPTPVQITARTRGWLSWTIYTIRLFAQRFSWLWYLPISL